LLLGVLAAAAIPVTASADNVYWSGSSSSAIRYGNLGGGTAASVFAGEQAPAEVAISPGSDTVYWADTVAGTIRAGSLETGVVQTLYTEPAGAEPAGIAINASAGKLYWTDAGSGKVQVGSTTGGGNPTTLFTEAVGARPGGLSINSGGSGTLYWADAGSGTIRAGSLAAGASATTLYTEAGGEPSGVAVAPETKTIYWTASATGAIQSAPLAGGGTVSRLYTEAAGAKPRGLAIDASRGEIYWTNSGSGEVRDAALAGSGVEQTLFSGEGEPSFPAVLANPVGTGVPKISGHYTAGNTLTCGSGRWAANAPGANYYAAPRSYAYQWSLAGVPISGATAAAYVPASEGSYTCAVTASNGAGATAQTSVAIKVKAAAPTASIASPASGGAYEQNASVPTSFSCAEGAGGPGLSSCSDSNGVKSATGQPTSGQLVTNTIGAHTYTVTAVSKNGKRASASIAYTVVGKAVAPKPKPKPSTIAIKIDKAPVRKGRTLILLACKGGTRCAGKLSLTATVLSVTRGRRTTRVMLFASRSYSLKAGERRDVALQLSRKAQALLTAAKHKKLKARARVTLKGGATKHRGVVLRLRR
jgi:hypothetical protein